MSDEYNQLVSKVSLIVGVAVIAVAVILGLL